MRGDMLAQLLLRADVRQSSRLLLIETCSGLLAGALLEKLAGKVWHPNLDSRCFIHAPPPPLGTGCLVQLHPGSPQTLALNWFNLSAEARVGYLPLAAHTATAIMVRQGPYNSTCIPRLLLPSQQTGQAVSSPPGPADVQVLQANFDGCAELDGVQLLKLNALSSDSSWPQSTGRCRCCNPLRPCSAPGGQSSSTRRTARCGGWM